MSVQGKPFKQEGHHPIHRAAETSHDPTEGAHWDARAIWPGNSPVQPIRRQARTKIGFPPQIQLREDIKQVNPLFLIFRVDLKNGFKCQVLLFCLICFGRGGWESKLAFASFTTSLASACSIHPLTVTCILV